MLLALPRGTRGAAASLADGYLPIDLEREQFAEIVRRTSSTSRHRPTVSLEEG